MPIGRARTSVTSQLTVDENLNMQTFKLTNLGAGSGNSQSIRYQQAILQTLLTTPGDLVVRGASVAGRLAKGTQNYYLKQGATYPEWAEDLIAALLTTRGDMLYEGASGVARLAKGTSGYFLQIGANDPVWASISLLTNQLLFPMLSEEVPSVLAVGRDASKRSVHSILHQDAIKITRIGVLVRDTTGSPGALYCEIWDDSGGSPNAVITNGSVSIAEGSIVDGAMNWFVFATPPELTAATLYWVVLRVATPGDSDYHSCNVFDGLPTNGAGVWGVGTIGKKYGDTTWSEDKPVIDIIKGAKV